MQLKAREQMRREREDMVEAAWVAILLPLTMRWRRWLSWEGTIRSDFQKYEPV